jgi:hypothetical protein
MDGDHYSTVECPLCEENMQRIYGEVVDQNDVDTICTNCYQRMEGTWTDLFIRGQAGRLGLLAEYAELKGADEDAKLLRDLSNELEGAEEAIREHTP